jgi:LAS superfamily LD-carboxypeptidase LdcB
MPINWSKVDKALLEPQLVKDVDKLLSGSEFEWVVTEGFRSIERSNELFKAYKEGRGPRAARGGTSAHNFGLAVDVYPDDTARPGIQPDWNTKAKAWRWLVEAVAAHPRLHSLWKLGDYPHIERYQWEQYKDWPQSTGGSQ